MAYGDSGDRGDFGGAKPVKVGDELDVTIEAVASKGDGIAKVQGFVVFVPGAKQGEQVRIRVTDVRSRHAVGEKVEQG